MNEKIDIKAALQVFEIIRSHGRKVDGEYHLNGLVASSDHDGYTATISNEQVTLDIFFHNRFSFNYGNRKERELFLEKLRVLEKNYRNDS